MDSVLQEHKACWRCLSRTGLESHHVFPGVANRPKSEKYGLKIWLCNACHTGRHKIFGKGIHQNRPFELSVKRHAQRYYEDNIGTREDFIRIFGKSWIDNTGDDDE
jgi:hypothetical protein